MILHLDLSTGASGDKLLGALLEVCENHGLVSFEELASKAGRLLPSVVIDRGVVVRGGIAATHITVSESGGYSAQEYTSDKNGGSLELKHRHDTIQELEFGYEFDKEDSPASDQGFESEHSHLHGLEFGYEPEHKHELRFGHEYEHSHVHEMESGYGLHQESNPRLKAHQTWYDIRLLINDAAAQGVVSAGAAKLAIRAFTRVAEAEARVHGVEPDAVHFHEVGAADSIIDILFSSFLLDILNPDAIYATPLALGNGTVICEHGELPVPAPATAEILAESGIPVYASSHDGELTTPTGAALIAEFVTEFAPLPCSEPLTTGYGAGSREISGASNILRIVSARPAPLAGLKAHEERQLFIEGVVQLECNLDHLSAEALAFVCEELQDGGALDVWQESIVMKKGRLAVKLTVLIKPGEASAFAEKIIELTGSLGVRSTYLERTVIPRTVLTLDTPYGPVPFKAAEMGAPQKRKHWLRPEHDAVARLAREHQLTYSDLYAELLDYVQDQRQGLS